MSVKVVNNAWGTLSLAALATDTAITLTAGAAARFGTLAAGQYMWLTLSSASNVLEVVKCTAIVGDVFTVVRAQDGTTARAYLAGDRVDLRPTAALFNDKLNASDAAATYATLASVASPLPVQTGNAAKFLTTDGSAPSWAQVYPTITGNAGKYLTTDGTNLSWALTPVTPASPAFAKGNSGTTAQVITQTDGDGQTLTVTGVFNMTAAGFPTGRFTAVMLKLINGGAFAWTSSGITWKKSDGTETTTLSAAGFTFQTTGNNLVLLVSYGDGVVYGLVR